MMKGAGGMEGGVEWSWRDDFNVWKNYSVADCCLIEVCVVVV